VENEYGLPLAIVITLLFEIRNRKREAIIIMASLFFYVAERE
jgi:hypothetical protein